MATIIGMSGWARAGKDTIADYLVREHGFRKISFADPMREALLRLNPLVRAGGMTMTLSQLIGNGEWEKAKSMTEDLRPLMQRLGTEVGREMFGEDFWVNLLLSKIGPNDKVVISDCRFKNEANAIKNAGGQVWRVERAGFVAANDHISEHDLDQYPFNAIFSNDLDISNLEKSVQSYANSTNI